MFNTIYEFYDTIYIPYLYYVKKKMNIRLFFMSIGKEFACGARQA